MYSRSAALLIAAVMLASLLLRTPQLAGAPPAGISLVSSYKTTSGIASIDISPNSSLIAVAERGGLVTVFNRTMAPLLSIKIRYPGFLQVKFVNDTLLAVVWERDGTHLSLVDLNTGSRRDIELLGNPAPLIETMPWRDGRLLMLFRGVLLLVDPSAGKVVREGDTPYAIVNTGVSIFRLNGSRVALLAVMTRCSICLANHEKVLVVFKPDLSIESKTTLNHVLAAYPCRNGTEILIIKDNGYADIYTASMLPTLKAGNAIKIYEPGSEHLVAGPGVLMVYGYKYGEGVHVRISPVERLVWRKAFIPLAGVKSIGEMHAAVSPKGFYAILLHGIGFNYLLAGEPGKVKAAIRLPESSMLGPVSDSEAIVYDEWSIHLYSLVNPVEEYRVVLRVYGERGEEVQGAVVRIGGNTTACPGGTCTLTLRRGVYTAVVEAPGYTPRRVVLNVTANTAVEVVLYRMLYSVRFNVVDARGNPCNATVVVKDAEGRIVYRGLSNVPAMLPQGNYTVLASCEGVSNTTTVYVSSNTTLTIVVPTGRYTLRVKLPEGLAAHVLVLGENGEVVYNSTATGSVEVVVPGGKYLVEVTAPGHVAYRRELAVTRDTEIEVSLEKLGENLRAVIYGLRGCPHCREVNATLHSLIPNTEFREISEQKYAEQYERLYRLLKAGNKGLVPLTLVFRGDRLILAAVGGDGAEWWRTMLSKTTSGKVLVVDDEGRVKYLEVNQSLVREIVEGHAAPRPPVKGVEGLLPLVVSLAAADSVNPCTFLVFTALLILTMRISGRRSMALAAAAFIAAIYTAYLLLGLGLLKVFASLPWLKYVLAALAFAFGAQSLWSIRGGEFHSPVPQRWKKLIEDYLSRIARTGSPLLAFGLGIVISLTLLPCSSGPYLVAMYALAKLPFYMALLYLLLYNVIFVAPLIGIMVSVAVASRKVRSLMKTRTKLPRYFEALAGILLIAIGVYVLLYM